MNKTIDNLRAELVVVLEKYDLLYEDITVNAGREEVAITFIRKFNTRLLQHFFRYLNEENINYSSYFCTRAKRIKVLVNMP
ncbi:MULTISPECIES: hypothetical protein [Emticicia]|uniref:hypothetical protein n=1 Tax=Emticicia TaxID=312278 RepID=UPI00209CC7DD|nr:MULTISPECIES: hypothetical protein [Emticicia]UTA66546.1 hypothetical protein MB380_13145 [Emticicia sp. 21SJ11W-3]